jgi:hypothetical protein
LLQPTFQRAIRAAPHTHASPADALRLADLEDPPALASEMVSEAASPIRGFSQVMAGVLKRPIEMEEVDFHSLFAAVMHEPHQAQEPQQIKNGERDRQGSQKLNSAAVSRFATTYRTDSAPPPQRASLRRMKAFFPSFRSFA